MELTDILDFLKPEEGDSNEGFKNLHEAIVATKEDFDYEEIRKQYESNLHIIHDRIDKVVTTDKGDETITVARLSLPLQKHIVGMAAAFLCGNPIQLKCEPKDETQQNFLDIINKTWEDNKLDYDSMELARIMMSETEVAEIWYKEDAEEDHWEDTILAGVKEKLRMKILANSLGDSLYPVFNKKGDMIAFAREYELESEEGDEDETHFDVYTDTQIYFGVQKGGKDEWTFEKKANAFGKIPIIYYSQPAVEWDDVQSLIDRLEDSISKHADTNDYTGSPIILVKGKILSFAKKGEAGKLLQLDHDADASYLESETAPESISLEQKNLRSFTFDFTQTPDISIEQMKALGTYSGIALKMIFLAPHLKAARKEGIYGKSTQRRINLMIAASLKIAPEKLKGIKQLKIKPKFTYYLPKNEQEIIEILATATGGKQTLSRKTAVAQNPLVENAETELDLIEEEILAEAPTLDETMNE